MLRAAASLALLTLGLAAAPASADDEAVRGTVRAEEEKVWVDVDNALERAIMLKSVTVAFLDAGGGPISRETILCKEKCEIAPGQTGTLGPITGPADWEDAEVTKVAYK